MKLAVTNASLKVGVNVAGWTLTYEVVVLLDKGGITSFFRLA